MDEANDQEPQRLYELFDRLDRLSDQLNAMATEMAEEAQAIRAQTEVRTLEHWWGLGA
jgi:hypothetical protein